MLEEEPEQLATPQQQQDAWQRLEEECTATREQNCRSALARILGGDPADPDEPIPRIAICLGGAANWDTPLSCVAFLDGLSAPLHASSTHTGTNGSKLIDAVSTVACSGTASWVCGAMLDSLAPQPSSATSFSCASGDDSAPPPGAASATGRDPRACERFHTPFHGNMTQNTQSNPWRDWEAVFGDAHLTESAEDDTETALGRGPPRSDASVMARNDARNPFRPHFVEPCNPWRFGPSNFFNDKIHTYNGLVAIFSRPHLAEAAQLVDVEPMQRLVISAAVGNGLFVPGALLSPSLGDTIVTRWANFLHRVWLRSANRLPNARSAPAVNQKQTADLPVPPEQPTVNVCTSTPLFDSALTRAMQSGQFPFVIFAALDVQALHTLRSVARAEDDRRSWYGPQLRWMEFTPLYVRCSTPLSPVTSGGPGASHNADFASSARAKAVVGDDLAHIRVDLDGAAEIPNFGERTEPSLSARDKAAPKVREAGAAANRGEPLSLHHVMAMCASGLPLTIVEQEYVYVSLRGDTGEPGDDSHVTPMASLFSNTCPDGLGLASPLTQATDRTSRIEQDADFATILNDDLARPPPSPRLLSSVIEGSAAHLPWAAVPLYARHLEEDAEASSSTRPMTSLTSYEHAAGLPAPQEAAATSTPPCVVPTTSVTATRMASDEETPAAASEQLFAVCRDPTASFRTPLPSLLEASCGRQFDIVIVHDTAPSANYARVPESLARAVELGLYKLDERFAEDESVTSLAMRRPSSSSASSSSPGCALTRPFDAHEVVRVFHGAPDYPTVIYFFGLPGRRCFESALDADTLRRACQEVRSLVMEHVIPVCIHQARRWRYLRKTHYLRLSPMQERALRVVPTHFAAVGVPKLARSRTVMQEVWEKVCRADAVHQWGSTLFHSQQTIVDYTGIVMACLFDMELRDARGPTSLLEFYRMVTAAFFGQLSPQPRAAMLARLQASALHYLSSGGATRAWHPLEYFFPTMDEEERSVLRMALHFNVFQWRKVARPPNAPRTFKAGLPEAAGCGHHIHQDDRDEVQVSLRSFGAVYFAFGAMLRVFRPSETRLLGTGASEQTNQCLVSSINDYYRVEWLRSNLSVVLIYQMCLGALCLEAWDEVVEVLSDAFARQICDFWDTVQRRVRSVRRGAQTTSQPAPLINLSEDRIERASAPLVPPGAPSEQHTHSSDRSGGVRRHVGTPPCVSSYAPPTTTEPRATLSVRCFCTAVALALETLCTVDTVSGEEKAVELLERIRLHMENREPSEFPTHVVITAPASYTRGCEASYSQLFFITLTAAVGRHSYKTSFFKTVYECALRMHFGANERTADGSRFFFWVHTLEAVCDNVNAAVRRECQQFLLERVSADLTLFAQQVATTQPTAWRDGVGDVTGSLWPAESASPDSPPVLGYRALREAYAYALPQTLALLVPRAPNDVNGFLSVLSATPSVYADPATQRDQLLKCLHLFLAHGWTEWPFFCFMVRTLVAKRVRMPYLCPAVYELTIPSYVERPLECAAVLQYASQCPQLRCLDYEISKHTKTASAMTSTSLEARKALPTKLPRVGGCGRRGELLTSSSNAARNGPPVLKRIAEQNLLPPVRGPTAPQRFHQRTFAQQAAVEDAVVARLEDGSGLSWEDRALAENTRASLPVELQGFLDTAMQCAAVNRQNEQQRPSDKVDRAIGSLIESRYS